ncbi:MAG: PEP-CTERM sorting domain-containing protein [Pirellulales bacterium]|nr:PEP-CTERM sorting domain-containing protein [Pirellulales bacterium]
MKIAIKVSVVVCLFMLSTCVSASLIDYAGSAYDGWAGTVSFDSYNPPFSTIPGLHGTVEYVVFAPGDFPTDCVGYTPTPGEFVYTYQITPDADSYVVSGFEVEIQNSADNPGSFTGDYVSGTGLNTPASLANWSFAGVPSGTSSVGLAFSSPYAPINLYGSCIDSGVTADIDDIPSPGENVPEPSTLVLLVLGANSLILARRRHA